MKIQKANRVFRKILWCIFLSLAVIAFAGGGAEEEKVLTVLVQGGSEAHTFVQETAEEYESLSGYTLNIVAVPYSGIYDKMTAEIVSPQGAYDVASIDMIWLPAWASKLVPQDDLLTPEVRADLFDVTIGGATYKGKFYGLPNIEAAKTIMYRKDLFEDPTEKNNFKAKYGYELKTPDNWQEFMDVAEFFTRDSDGDGVVDLYGAYVGAAAMEDVACTWFDFALQAGAKDLIVDENGKVVINSKPYIDSLQFLSDMVNKDKVAPPGALEILCVQGAELFRDGKLAMMWNWPFGFKMANDSPESKVNGKVGSIPMIGGTAGRAVTNGTWINVIPQSSKRVEEAKNYVKFWYERDKLMFQLTGAAARKSTFEYMKGKPGGEIVESLYISLNAESSRTRPKLIKYEQISAEVVLPALQAVIGGSKTAEQAVADAEKQIQEILK